MPPIVGRKYTVLCVRLLLDATSRRTALVPVIGPPHTDPELNVTQEHWHVDWRFLTERQRIAWLSPHGLLHDAPKLVIQASACVGEPVTLSKKCVRSHPPPWPEYFAWLQHRFAGKRAETVDGCKRCPHRGVPIDGAPVVNGLAICPGHGLRFDGDTVASVERSQPQHTQE